MPTELVPGTFTRVFARVAVSGDLRVRTGLVRLANAVEGAAKDNLRQSTHRYGTPTPSVPGLPPALISGTLRRAMTHSPILAEGPSEWSTKVGTATGFYPPYPRASRDGGAPNRTPAHVYGYLLEMGLLRNGAAYPFLRPAYHWGIAFAAPTIWRDVMRAGRW